MINANKRKLLGHRKCVAAHAHRVEGLFHQYSPALKASKLTWSTKTLNKFLMNPGEIVPGTFMPIQIPDDKTRADVVAYLATLKKWGCGSGSTHHSWASRWSQIFNNPGLKPGSLARTLRAEA